MIIDGLYILPENQEDLDYIFYSMPYMVRGSFGYCPAGLNVDLFTLKGQSVFNKKAEASRCYSPIEYLLTFGLSVSPCGILVDKDVQINYRYGNNDKYLSGIPFINSLLNYSSYISLAKGTFNIKSGLFKGHLGVKYLKDLGVDGNDNF